MFSVCVLHLCGLNLSWTLLIFFHLFHSLLLYLLFASHRSVHYMALFDPTIPSDFSASCPQHWSADGSASRGFVKEMCFNSPPLTIHPTTRTCTNAAPSSTPPPQTSQPASSVTTSPSTVMEASGPPFEVCSSLTTGCFWPWDAISSPSRGMMTLCQSPGPHRRERTSTSRSHQT